MNISTTSRHYDLAPALKDYAEGKVQNLRRYFNQIVNANLIFSLEKYRHRVEITLHVNGRDFVSIEESDDMYAAVDKSVDKLETQLRRHKDKIKRRKNQARLSDVPVNGDGQDKFDEDKFDEDKLDEDETLDGEIQ